MICMYICILSEKRGKCRTKMICDRRITYLHYFNLYRNRGHEKKDICIVTRVKSARIVQCGNLFVTNTVTHANTRVDLICFLQRHDATLSFNCKGVLNTFNVNLACHTFYEHGIPWIIFISFL